MTPLLIVLCFLGGIVLFLFIPYKGAHSYIQGKPGTRIREEDHVLSRRLLAPGSKAHAAYYSRHPEKLEADEKSRSAPGLLDRKSRYFHPGTFASAEANFKMIDYLGGLTHEGITSGATRKDPVKINPIRTSRYIYRWLTRTGAHDVGITYLKDYHLYSHKGRGTNSGFPIRRSHEHAIAITVQMDHHMIRSAPQGSTVMESSEQYLRAGVLALKLAAWIRELGYEAKAHIDGYYEVICPLVASDAGLGTIGRMGLLMTPGLGPRVRISVVTTNLPLSHTKGFPDRTVLHFCHFCKKCTEVCPSNAIPDGPRKMIQGSLRWQIDSEKCYHFWTISGTDCGRCISACPYSHPDNGFHRFIRWGIKNNLFFRHMAIKLDDLIYGRKPAIRAMPDWSDILD